MRIVYCIPHLHKAGGMQRILTEKVNFFADIKEFEITIVTTDQMGNLPHFELNSKVDLIHLDLDFDGHFNSSLFNRAIQHYIKINKYRVQLTKILNELDVDICVSLCGKEVDFLCKIPGRFAKIAELHFSSNFKKQFINANYKGLVWQAIGSLANFFFKRALMKFDKVVVLTLQDLISLKAKHKNVIKINNFTSIIPTKMGDLNTKKAISIGKLNSQKGFDILIDVWEIVSKFYPEWVLEIYGEGEWELFLMNKIEQKGLKDQIKLKGLASNVEVELFRSSIYIMSSRFEGFGLVLIEAMSCGIPVVSFDCEAGPREILEDGISGFLVQPGNIEELAERIIFLIENPSIRKDMGKRAIDRSKDFSKNKILNQWYSLFVDLHNQL
ncbi:glycosyltransferase family 4 protein [Aquirufa sp.]|jgi:glycosyltransferase involved in cell wall biosynthesis|uniref:glycosyltransferase family 4 protein n=1 Tax=Aquirufa sp. TaxID=2676249 RepID=UPI0037C15979